MRVSGKTFTMLSIGLVTATLIYACSAILDTEELQSGNPLSDSTVQDGGDAAPEDSGLDMEDGAADDATIDAELDSTTPSCTADKTCTVAKASGRCSIGTTQCTDAGVMSCKAKYAKAAEKCDGVALVNDQDCDGKKDDVDTDAHSACGAGKYCGGSACKNGCWSANQCTGATDRCTNHACKCGSQDACAQPNPVCSDGRCGCDANSTCNAKETCNAGVCNCGASQGPNTGPFCPVGTCNPATGVCDGLPQPDAGPEAGPVDQGPPDQAPVDVAAADQAVD